MTIFTPIIRRRLIVRTLLASWACLLFVLSGLGAQAAESPADKAAAAQTAKKRFDIPAGDAFSTLKRFSAQSGAQLIYKAESLDGVKTAAVRGTYTPREALGYMLVRTTLSVTQDDQTGTFAITRAATGSDLTNRDSDRDSATKKKSPPP